MKTQNRIGKFIYVAILLLLILMGCVQNNSKEVSANSKLKNISPDLQIYTLMGCDSNCQYFGMERLPPQIPGRVGVWHKTRGIIIEPIYSSAYQLSNCKWLVIDKDQQKAIFDTLGNQLTKFENDFQVIASASSYSDLAVVHENKNVFLINPPHVKPLGNEKYSKITIFKNGFFGFANKDTHLYALGSREGLRITEFEYDFIDQIDEFSLNNPHNLSLLKKDRYLVAYLHKEGQGYLCLDNNGEEVACVL